MARQTPPHATAAFEIVQAVGRELPGIEATTKYDGSPVLKLGGCFMAGLARHPSSEPDTLVTRYAIDDRDALLEEAPDIYYVTDYYRPYPVVLARLPQLDRDALRDLLTVSYRLTAAKRRKSDPGRRSSRSQAAWSAARSR
jgi:hypothetical protein